LVTGAARGEDDGNNDDDDGNAVHRGRHSIGKWTLEIHQQQSGLVQY
jgi:hypothetical protein